MGCTRDGAAAQGLNFLACSCAVIGASCQRFFSGRLLASPSPWMQDILLQLPPA